jgi:hypothetical protein
MATMSGFGHVMSSHEPTRVCRACGRALNFKGWGYEECDCEEAEDAYQRHIADLKYQKAERIARHRRCPRAASHDALQDERGCPWCPPSGKSTR